MSRISASKVDLAMACLYWARPDVELPPDVSSDAARFGSARHKCAELHVSHKPVDIAAIAEHYTVDADALRSGWDALRMWLDELMKRFPDGIWSEVPLSYDTATGNVEELDSAGHRDYSKAAATAISGTLDLMWTAHGEAYVADIKGSLFGHTPPARENGQLMTQALMAAIYYGVGKVNAALVFAEPKGVTEDATTFYTETFGGLKDHGRALKALLDEIPNAQPVTGAHCTEGYCPLRDICPARVAIVQKETPTIADLDVRTIKTPEDVRKFHRRLAVVEEMAEAAREQIKAVVHQFGRVDLGDGKALISVVEKAPRTKTDWKSVASALDAPKELVEAYTKAEAECRKSIREVKAA